MLANKEVWDFEQPPEDNIVSLHREGWDNTRIEVENLNEFKLSSAVIKSGQIYLHREIKENVPISLLYVESDPDEFTMKQINALSMCQSGDDLTVYKRGARFGFYRFLRASEESHSIQEACDVGCHNIEMSKFFNIRKHEFSGLIMRTVPKLVHFSGHGSKEGRLIVCSPLLSGKTYNFNLKIDYLSTDEIIRAFHEQKVEAGLVVLAACYTSEWLKPIVDSGCAKVAIGINGKVKENDIITFSTYFYRGLTRQEWVYGSEAWLNTIHDIFNYAKAQFTSGEKLFSIYPDKPPSVKSAFPRVIKKDAYTDATAANALKASRTNGVLRYDVDNPFNENRSVASTCKDY
jgi:hypothetical protein